jgi:1,4-dihydroxy-2-naphthoyl-CoA synthase
MGEIATERDGSILRIQLNRPSKRNAMTSAMYVALAAILADSANDGRTRVVLWQARENRSVRVTISRTFSRILLGQASDLLTARAAE